jgi:hypothetical protein
MPPGTRVSIFSGVGIGLMVGMVLGLAAPPADGKSIVGYFIAAVGAALAAMLGLNDAHFSTAKGLRIGAFGLAVLVAAPTGIFIREHQVLSPNAPAPLTLAEKKAQYLALGFDEAQALDLLRREIETDGGAPSGAQAGARTGAPSGGGERRLASTVVIPSSLMSGEVVDGATCDKLTRPADQEAQMATDDVVQNFELEGGPWKTLAEQSSRELRGDDRKAFLYAARDALLPGLSLSRRGLRSPDAARIAGGAPARPGLAGPARRGTAAAGSRRRVHSLPRR